MICCVKTGDRYGAEYVLRLRDGVRRHLPRGADTSFVCFTDRPVDGVDCEPLPVDLPGWWAKLGLFKLGRQLTYFDLDMVFVGSLAPLLKWQGFGIIKNPRIVAHGYNSSVMKLTGHETHVWTMFRPEVMQQKRGDQDWINIVAPHAPTFPPQWFPSWKVDQVNLMDGPPKGAIAINCHGSPKPHEIDVGWVRKYWKGTAQ